MNTTFISPFFLLPFALLWRWRRRSRRRRGGRWVELRFVHVNVLLDLRVLARPAVARFDGRVADGERYFHAVHISEVFKVELIRHSSDGRLGNRLVTNEQARLRIEVEFFNAAWRGLRGKNNGVPLAHLFTTNHFKAGILFFELDVAVKICAALHRGQLWTAQLALPARPFHPADLAVIARHRDALLLSRDRDQLIGRGFISLNRHRRPIHSYHRAFHHARMNLSIIGLSANRLHVPG